MKLAVLGGSFNPVHNGHIDIAHTVHRDLGYNKVLFIPAFNNPHKKRISSVSDEQRLYMLHLALDGLSWTGIDTCELDRGGLSYTIDTIRYLSEKYSLQLEGRIGFVIGDDLVESFSRWREPEVLTREADLIVAHRLFKEKCSFNYPHTYLNNPVFTPSSTEVRNSIRNKGSSSGLVPPQVSEYILSEGLYDDE